MTDLSNAGNDPMRSDDADYYYDDSDESTYAAQQDAEWDAADYDAEAGVDSGDDYEDVDTSLEDDEATGGASEKSAIVLMVVLLVLAAIASVVMLFAGSTGWMKIAVLLALWSAVIGLVLVTRYRKTVAQERERLANLKELHRAELDQEMAAHREQELILEQNYMDSIQGDSNDSIAALRAEVFALRAQLAEFMGENFDDEQVALRARAERLRELDSAGYDRARRWDTSQVEEDTADGAGGAHTRYGGAWAASEASSQVEDAEATDMRRTFSPAGQPVDVPEVADSAGSAEEGSQGQEPGKFSTGSFRAIYWQESPAQGQEEQASQERQARRGRHAGKEDQDDAPRRGAHEAGSWRRAFNTADGDDNSETRLLPQVDDSDAAEAPVEQDDDAPAAAVHGRRRAEDNKGSLTVAELMAQMREKGAN